jgi:hypothetical protein
MNMKKSLYAAIALLMGVGTLHAEHVDKTAALKTAAQFMQTLNPQASIMVEPAKKSARRTAEGTESTNEAYYYIFNAENNQGFVIVSGDDRTPQVLGYSDKGHIDTQNVPVNLQEMLDSYEAQIKMLDTMSDYVAGTAMAKRRASSTRNSISPMITTNWDQADPYWNKCPQFMKEEGSDEYELAYTGCVATSMSQIMNFYKFPQQTTQEIPSYEMVIAGDNYSYSTQNTDPLPVTTFDWEHMLNNYNGAEAEVYTDAVATLMLYAGHAVKMQYGTSSSAAYTDDIVPGFTKYFGYDASTIRVVYRNDYEQNSWNDLIYNELAAGRPMIYNGTAGSGGGHSFICDGFESGDYFHINWGWGGMSNGYFLLEVMNPHASGIGGASSSEGYNMKQNAVIGIQPGGGSEVNPEQIVENLTATNLYWNYSSDNVTLYTDDDGFYRINKNYYLNVGCSDHTGTGKKYVVGIALYDETGTNKLEDIWGETVFQTRATSATGLVTQIGKGLDTRNSYKFGKNLAAGTYRIVPVCQLQGSDEWKPMLESDRYYVEFNVTTYGYATAKCHPSVSLEVTNYAYIGKAKVGSAESIDVTLKNNSPDRFYGNLYLFVDNEPLDDQMTPYTTTIQAEVPAGGEKTVTFNFTPKNSGAKSVKVCLDDNGEKVLSKTSSITIAPADGGTMDLSVAIEAVNAVHQTPEEGADYPIHGNIYDTHSKFKVTLTNNDAYEYNRYILVPLFICSQVEKTNDDGSVTKKWGGQMVTYKMETISIGAKETKDFYYEFDNLAPGSVYSVNVYARNDNPDDATGNKTDNLVGHGESKYYQINNGVVTWTSAGVRTSAQNNGPITVAADAAAVSLMGLGNEVQITPNDNPNCLYFFDAEQTVPESLAGKNVIKGYVAESIVLADGYDYFTPYTFTAQNISYSRTFAQGRPAQGGEQGWETLVLPFAATEVTDANGTAIDWYKSDTDEIGKFWICNFSEEENDETYFNYVATMAADRPYLVAVPEGSDLVNSELTFKATKAQLKPGVVAVTSGKIHSMVGTYVKQTVENIYKLSNVGHQFELATSGQEIGAFRAYFNTLEGQTSEATALTVLFKLTGDVEIPGDINLDGVVNLADVTALVDILNNGWNSEVAHGATDINGNGAFDVEDVEALATLLLNK